MNPDEKITVLVGDDEPADLGTLSEHLRQADYKVLMVQDGADALERVEHSQPDVILLNVKLADMDGSELCHRLEEMDTPVVFLNAKSDIVDKLKGLNLEAVDYVTKPFEPAEVVARVEKHVIFHKMKKQLEEQNAQLQRANAQLSHEITERKRIENELRESEERAEAILNATTDTITLLASDGTVLAINTVGAGRFGKQVGELVGICVYDLFPPDVAASRKVQIEEVVRTGKPVRFEDKRAGRTFDNNLYPVFDARGDVTVVAVYARDITERKRTEEALRESESKFRNFVEQSSEGIMLVDEQGYVIEWNQGVEQLTGLKREEVLGKFQWDIQFQLLPDERKTPAAYERFKSTMLEALRTGQASWMDQSIEAAYQHQDGSERIVQQRLFPIRTEQGFWIGGISTDITERKRIIDELAESEEKFRNLAEQSPNMIFINKGGSVVYANRRCEQMIGYTREEFYASGFDFLTLIAPQSRDLVKTNFQKHMRGEDVPPYEYVLVTKEGRPLDVIITPKLIQFEGEKAILGVITDITKRRQAEEALNQRVEELAALNQIAHMVASVTDLPVVLGRVSQVVTTLFDACFTCIVLPAAGENEAMFLYGFHRKTGILEPSLLGPALANFPLYRLVFSQSIPEPLVVSASDWQSESLVDFPLLRQALSQAEPRDVSTSAKLSQLLPPVVREVLTPGSLQSLMVIPLVVRGAAIGFMSVAKDQASRSYTADDVSLAETLVGDIAAAIENMRLMEQVQSVAAAEERSRLARDLHDAVTQTIYSANLIVEVLPKLWERNPDEGLRNLVKVRQLVRGALAEMRTLLFELRPSALEGANLGTLLGQLGDVLTGQTRIPVEVTLEDQGEIPVPVKIAFYRITQEVFNNIAKHARATQVSATLQQTPDQVILSIRDNGYGFDPASTSIEHMGLRIMRERAEDVGASLKLESEPGRGTQVSVSWPTPAKS